jgi:hypothetical protein
MSLDEFKRILFNAGEQAVIADFNALQAQMHMMIKEMLLLPGLTNATMDPSGGLGTRWDPEQRNQILSGDVPPTDIAVCPYPSAGFVSINGAGARQLRVGAAGPIGQVINDSNLDATGGFNPDDPALLLYWMHSDEFTLTTAIGHATLPRIDIVEMKLEVEDGANEARVYDQPAVKAELDLDPLTTHVDTVIQSRVGGTDGNSISIAFANDGSGAGSLTASGFALTFHFQTGVTTVTNFETAVAASTLIEIQSVGTGANIFTTGGDTLAATHLAGGTAQILVSSSVPKSRHTKATFQIKQGTANATPTYPTPSVGFVAIAAVYVPALHNAVHSLANIRDLRWPLGGVKVYDVLPRDFILGTSSPSWARTTDEWSAVCSAGTTALIAPCPVGGGMGRIIGIGVVGNLSFTAPEVFLKKVALNGTPTLTNLLELQPISDDLSGGFGFSWANAIDLMEDNTYVTGIRLPDTRVGNAFWTDGSLAGPAQESVQSDVLRTTMNKVYVHIKNASGAFVHAVRFVIAHGMG